MPDEQKTLEDLKRLQDAEEEAGTENVEVEDPDGDDPEAPPEPSPRREARRERASKFKAEQEARAAAERERDDLRIRLAAAEAVQRVSQPARDEPKPDPADDEIKNITKEMSDLQAQYGQLTDMAAKANQPIAPDVVKGFRDKWEALNIKRSEQIAERTHRRASAAQPAGPSAQEAAAQAALQQRYSDVVAHPNAKNIAIWCSGQWQSHLASGGSNDMEQMDRIVNEARRKFGLAKSPAPSPAVKARYSSVGAGATAATNGDHSAADVKNFPVSKHQRAMAMEMYPDLPEKKAVQKWIQIQLKRGVKTA